MQELRSVIARLSAPAQEPQEAARNVSDEQAEREIAAVLQSGEPLYPSDLSDLLHLTYDQVTRVLNNLQARGEAEPLTPEAGTSR
jgi:DNA-binding MarR family transcriptional regulator